MPKQSFAVPKQCHAKTKQSYAKTSQSKAKTNQSCVIPGQSLAIAKHNIPMQRWPSEGFTLIELLVSLSILAILSFVAIPGFSHLVEQHKSNTRINQLHELLRYTRNEALARHSKVSLCPTSDTLSCHTDWAAGVMVYIDTNNNRRRDQSEQVLTQRIPLLEQGSLSFNAPHAHITFEQRGFPLSGAGSFIYCSDTAGKQDLSLARALILSFQGRIRHGKDSNQDGIVETTARQNVEC